MTDVQSDRLDWLNDLNGKDAIKWVNEQNKKTILQLQDKKYKQNVHDLSMAFGQVDRAPDVTRIGEFVYNFWRTAQQPQGIWRRMSYPKFKCGKECWDVLLDLDELSRKEKRQLFWDGVDILPTDPIKAILRLSEGGSDAVRLREWDLVSRTFVEDGFNVDTAISSTTWLDPDTLLLASSHGGTLNSTISGNPRNIRLWRRGQPLDDTKVLFSTAPESALVGVERDWTVAQMRLYLTEIEDGDKRNHYVAHDTFDFKRISLPQDVRCKFRGDLAAVYLKEDWNTATRVFSMDTLLVMRVNAPKSSFSPQVLWESAEGCALDDFQFIDHFIYISSFEHLRPVPKLLVQGTDGWQQVKMPSLTKDGVVSIRPLNHFAHEGDSTVVITEESPLLPRKVSLSTLGSREAPFLLRQSPHVYDATDLAIEYHSVYMDGVGKVPYVQIGRARSGRTSAPLYMYGYGGFGRSVKLSYDIILGVLVYQYGWSVVLTCLPGDGNNGLRYEKAGRKEFKSRAHDAFAMIASHLVERGVTEASKLFGVGASNGGLMIGMMVSRFPHLFAALACELPLTDLHRFEQWSAGQTWSAEYPQSLVERLKISPCHCMIPANKDAPHVLVFTNRLDDRVHPTHARRLACLLQKYGYNALFFEAESGGHGYGANLHEAAIYFALRDSLFRQALESQAQKHG